MTRHRHKGLPKIDQRNMRQLYTAVFGEPMPKGWRVTWARLRGNHGWCWYSKRLVELSHKAFYRNGGVEPRTGESALECLIHEFVHLRMGKSFRHGAEFTRIVQAACEAVGVVAHRHTEERRYSRAANRGAK